MSTIRVERTTHFTTVPNATARDASLSFRARGVLTWLLSHTDTWRVDSTDIAAAGTEGRDAIRSALNELETAGYLVRVKNRNTQGQWVTESVVTDVPNRFVTSSPAPENPASADQSSESQALIEEHPEDHEEPSSLREEDHQSKPSTGTTEAHAIAKAYWDWHKEERGRPPAGVKFLGLRSAARSLLKSGYTHDEIIEALKTARGYSAKVVTDEAARLRRVAEERTGQPIPVAVVRAFGKAKAWDRSRYMEDRNGRLAMGVVAYFVTKHDFGIGETMLRLAVALRQQAVVLDADELTASMWKAKVDRFPGELDDYPDAMERAFRNQYWRAS